MGIYLKFDYDRICRSLIKMVMDQYGISHRLPAMGNLEILPGNNPETVQQALADLEQKGVSQVEDKKAQLVQQIRDAITELIQDDEKWRNYKISVYLAEKLDYSYTYLSTLFSETTYTSIENFIILKKIDHAKELLTNSDLTLTEVAFRLNYSSVAHLSGQFKKTTGITPSQFQRIVQKRRKNNKM